MILNFNKNLVKATAAVALTITGTGVVNAVKPTTNAHVQAATMRVKINYVPSYGINIWTNFNHGHFTGVRAQHGTTWNVLATETDKKGNTWYEVGQNQWIMAKYTVSANKHVKRAHAKRVVKNAAVQNNVAAPAEKHHKKSVQASGNASAVVSLARAQAGKRYFWGATGPSSFDCSGLVQYVYSKAAGINVTRTTYSQIKQGKAVSLNALQPGDLLFWGSYHVGIYLGNGQYVHAATPSQGVRVQTISRYFYPTSARRILG